MRGDVEWGSIPGLVRARCAGTATPRRSSRAVAGSRTPNWAPVSNARPPRASRPACAAATGSPIWAPNTLDWIVSALGAVTAGAVLVPLNTRFKGAEAAYVLARSRATAAVRDGYVPRHVVRGVAAPGRGRGPGRRPAAGTAAPGAGGGARATTPPTTSAPGRTSWRRGRRYRRAAVRERGRRRSARTTPRTSSSPRARPGRPKGAVITHAQTLRALRGLERAGRAARRATAI